VDNCPNDWPNRGTGNDTHAVGLVFAANSNGEYAWIIPMSCVTNAFQGLNLVSGHSV
jgi:hypothetical protein